MTTKRVTKQKSQQESLLTLWAMPKKEEVPLILSTKKEINTHLNGPKFPLHMTLAGTFNLNPSEIKNVELGLSKSFSPFKVFFKGYGMKDYFFQAFYVAVELNEELKRVRVKICDILNTENLEFMPHLSLYYGKEAHEKKQSLLKELPNSEGNFVVDTFYLVSFDPTNIEWKILNSIRLEGL